MFKGNNLIVLHKSIHTNSSVNIEHQCLPALHVTSQLVSQLSRSLSMERRTDPIMEDSLKQLLTVITGKPKPSPLALRGKALAILPNIPTDKQTDYAAVFVALKTKFGSYQLQRVYMIQLKTRIQPQSEIFQVYGTDI